MNVAAPLFNPRAGVVDVEDGSLGGVLCIYYSVINLQETEGLGGSEGE